MNIFGLSITKKQSPGELPVGEFAGRLERVEAVIEEQITDVANLITAIQRVERKQNRWLEVLNLTNKDMDAALAAKTPEPDDGNKGLVSAASLLSGAEEED